MALYADQWDIYFKNSNIEVDFATIQDDVNINEQPGTIDTTRDGKSNKLSATFENPHLPVVITINLQSGCGDAVKLFSQEFRRSFSERSIDKGIITFTVNSPNAGEDIGLVRKYTEAIIVKQCILDRTITRGGQIAPITLTIHAAMPTVNVAT